MKKLIIILIAFLITVLLSGCSLYPNEMTIGVFGAETNYGSLGKAPMTGGSVSFTWQLNNNK